MALTAGEVAYLRARGLGGRLGAGYIGPAEVEALRQAPSLGVRFNRGIPQWVLLAGLAVLVVLLMRR